MVDHHTIRSEVLEEWSPRLVLAAAVLFVGHAVIRGIEAFTTMPPPADVFGPTGYVAAMLGLLGLYSSLADRSPTLSRVAALMAVGTIPGWGLIAGWTVGEAAGLLPVQTSVLPPVIFVVLILSTLLTYLLFGIACLRAESHTRTLGLLLLAPVAVLVLLIVGGVVLSIAADAGAVIVGSGLAILHGAIGATLLTGSAGTDHRDLSATVPME